MIASIVERARRADPPIPVMVVTGDRDAYQLVDDGTVRIMTTSRGITDTRVYDREGVIDRYGIPPELIPDFIGLKGDTSDNIPGVPGIGDKTAAELLQRFGSLEEVLDHVDEISGAKRKQNLIEHAEDARISKQLATAKRDIPLDLDLAEFVASRRPTARSCGTPSGSSSCASPCAGSRRRSARPTPPRRRPPPSRRSPRASGRRRSTTSPSCPQTEVAVAVRAQRAARGRAVRARPRLALRRPRHGARSVLAGDVRRPERARQGARRAGRSSPTTPSRWARSRRAGPRHRDRRLPARAGPPRLSVPRADRGARAGRRAWRTRPPPTRCWPARWPHWQREEIRGRGLTDLMERGRAAAGSGAAGDGEGRA